VTVNWVYTPGSKVAIVSGPTAVLVDLPADDPLVRELLDALAGAPALEDVLEVLLSQGLRRIPSFVAAAAAEDGSRVLVRGSFTAAPIGGEPVTGSGLWLDHTFTGAPGLRITAGGNEGLALPIGEGVVLADALTASVGSGAQNVEPPAAPQPAEPPSVVPEPPTTDVAVHEPEPAGDPGTQPEPARPAVVAPPAPDLVGAPAVVIAPAVPTPAMPVAAEPQPVGSPSPASAAMEAAEDRVADEKPEAEPAAQPSTPPAGPPPAGGGLLIESFPWASSGTDDDLPAFLPAEPAPAWPAPVPPKATEPAAPTWSGEFDQEAAEMTVDRSRLIEHAAQAASSVLVVAARCPAGHLSPAYAGTCRVCHQPLPPQQPTEVPRPQLGILRLSNGDTVALDRGVILGRNPRLPSGYSGEQPNLVRLTDPGKDVSSQHLEVSLDYWHVLVSDLGSTNGTEVILPGRPPIQLRPNDPMTIEPGTRVVLAGVFDFVFEVTA
jgi:hypothetical protein